MRRDAEGWLVEAEVLEVHDLAGLGFGWGFRTVLNRRALGAAEDIDTVIARHAVDARQAGDSALVVMGQPAGGLNMGFFAPGGGDDGVATIEKITQGVGDRRIVGNNQ
jgi:hypothetical protein